MNARAEAPQRSRSPEVPPQGELLATLRSEHPRIWIDAERLKRLSEDVAHDRLAASILDRLRDDAERLLEEPPLTHRLQDGRRLLFVSAEMSQRIQKLALVYLLDSDPAYARRAYREMESAAEFRDWNPAHFLDTAEMSLGLAIGYDWLYDTLTPDERSRIRDALIHKGLRPALECYHRRSDWHKNTNNWNQVCNGGIAIAALAIADESPQLAEEILREAIASVPRALTAYAPDGAGHEGVTYWEYGSRFSVFLITALESALGDDFGLAEAPGFLASADYGLYLSGADRVAINFADCKARPVTTPQHLWFGERAGSLRHAAFRRDALAKQPEEGGLYDLLWWSRADGEADLVSSPLDRHFRNAELVSMRTTWTDPLAAILAVQGGSNNQLRSHRQLDLGAFVYESGGVRWFIDQGTESQTYHKHRHGVSRGEFYRVRAEGHNTLVIDPGPGPDQNPAAEARFVEFESNPDGARAVLDLSEAYPGWSVARAVEFDRDGVVEIRDTLSGTGKTVLWWFAHTTADIEIAEAGRVARLRAGDQTLKVQLLSEGGVFEILPAVPMHASAADGIQELDPSVKKLAIRLEVNNSAELGVLLSPNDNS